MQGTTDVVTPKPRKSASKQTEPIFYGLLSSADIQRLNGMFLADCSISKIRQIMQNPSWRTEIGVFRGQPFCTSCGSVISPSHCLDCGEPSSGPPSQNTDYEAWQLITRDDVQGEARTEKLAQYARQLLKFKSIDLAMVRELLHAWGAAKCWPVLLSSEVDQILDQAARAELDRIAGDVR